MTTATSVRELLSDPTFNGLMGWWKLHRRPPEPLVDWLLDQGREREAAAIRWVLNEPDRPVYIPGGKSGQVVPECGPFPFEYSSSSHYFTEKSGQWGWACIKDHPDKAYGGHPDCLPWCDDRLWLVDFPDLDSALIFLMDSYPGD